jgi:LytR cell envelope-related transcriptional attenuator
MTDFFDDLERQLVAATPQREARVRRARARRVVAAVSAIVVLLAGGAGIAAAVGGGDADGGADRGAPAGATSATAITTPAATTTPPPGPEPYSYEVAVLNGTAVPGLGRSVATRLMGQQIRANVLGNAPRQDATETRVYYRSDDCLPAANQVAAALRLGDARGRFSLRPITKAQTALIGQGPAVLVVAGSDLNRPAGP